MKEENKACYREDLLCKEFIKREMIARGMGEMFSGETESKFSS
jgi:hypothetical protein